MYGRAEQWWEGDWANGRLDSLERETVCGGRVGRGEDEVVGLFRTGSEDVWLGVDARGDGHDQWVVLGSTVLVV